MPKVSVPQKKLVLDCQSGENLMDVLIAAGLPVASSCLGEGICSKCTINMNPVGHPSELEIKTMTRNKVDVTTHRLSCQLFVDGDISVETTYW